MKKYLFGILALTLAIGFSAFTTAKKTLTYTFTLDRVPTAESDIETTSLVDGKLVYTNWDRTAGLVECSAGEQRGCTILVDAKYTKFFNGKRYLNAEDPDAGGSLIAFPTMDAVIGHTISSTNYYKVNNSDVGTDIDVVNGTVN
jgi:hypothetical protein